MDDNEYFKTFFIDTTKDQFDYIEEFTKNNMENYRIEAYFIGYEANPKEHYHFVIKFNTKDNGKLITNYMKHFVEKYNLRRKGKGGKIKYGICRGNIKDWKECIKYCSKENNYRYYNFDDKLILKLYGMSYIKDNKLDKHKLLKNKIYKLFVEEYPFYNPPEINNFDTTYMTSFEDIVHKHSRHIKKFIFNKLLDEPEYELKSFNVIKSMSINFVWKCNKFSKDKKYDIIRLL